MTRAILAALALASCAGEESPQLTNSELAEVHQYADACMARNHDREQCIDACNWQYPDYVRDQNNDLKSLRCLERVHHVYVYGATP